MSNEIDEEILDNLLERFLLEHRFEVAGREPVDIYNEFQGTFVHAPIKTKVLIRLIEQISTFKSAEYMRTDIDM